MSYLFSCQGLAKSYGAQTLFTDISLVINPGDRVGLIGPNGSGKSTLLKIICNNEDEDRGTILRMKHCVISYLAQDDSFDDSLSLVDNLLAVLESAPIDEAEKVSRVQAVLSRAEFEDSTLPVSQLSGGWRKRVFTLLRISVRQKKPMKLLVWLRTGWCAAVCW